MTRITFYWLTLFVGGGILLLASGETTVSAIAEQTPPNKPSLLSVAATTSSNPDGSSTSEGLQTNSSRVPLEDNELRSNRSTNTSGDEISTSVEENTLSTVRNNSANESSVEDKVYKAELHKSETDLKNTSDSESSNEVNSTTQNDNYTSSHYLSTSESNTDPVVNGEKNATEADGNGKAPEMSTNSTKTPEESTFQESTRNLSSNVVGAMNSSSTSLDGSTREYETNKSSSEETSTRANSEANATEYSSLVETSGNPVTMETKSSLSAKSATRKRSINSTVITTVSDESLPTSLLFSSPSPHRGTEGKEISSTLLTSEKEFISTESTDEWVPTVEAQTTEMNSETIRFASPLAYSHITESSQGDDMKTDNSVEAEHDSEELRPDAMVEEMVHSNSSEDDMSSAASLSTEENTKLFAIFPGSTLKPSNKIIHGMGDVVEYGVTFDPDGMKNNGPQDPDSVVFSTSVKDFEKFVKPQTETTNNMWEGFDHHTNPTTEVEKESNPSEDVVNRTEVLENPNDADQRETLTIIASHIQNGTSPSETSMLNTLSSSAASSSPDPESQATGVSSSTTKHAERDYDDFDMVQDMPHDFSSDHNQSISGDIKVIEISDSRPVESHSSDLPASSSHLVPEVPLATQATAVEASSSFVVHQTEQSVIRPVKIKISSPSDSISTRPASAPESSPKPSAPTTGSTETAAGVESNPTDTSSPIILPNPAPSTTEKGNRELSTLLPELSSSSSLEKVGDTVATETTNFNTGANSTIAGVAVKTSVSVSLPLSNKMNESEGTLPSAFDELLKNSSIVVLPGNPPTIIVRENNDSSSPTTAESSSTGLTLTTKGAETTTTTTAASVIILKPKIKVPGGSETRTRRPYIPPSQKRASTTPGTPVAIFGKSRTRGASITSSTTARPFRPLPTFRIQYASDIPGMVPGGELLISTEPVTEPPTTTEEYFSEEPFTDQTYTPSVSTDDDVTLVKVAGYIVLERGIKWKDQLSNRHSLEYKEEAKMMHLHLERLFRSSSIAHSLWKIEIDGFSGNKKSRLVAVDFFLYLIKSHEDVSPDHLASVLQEKLSANNTFARFRVDPSRTAFERLAEERMIKTTPSPDQETVEPPIPQWAIAVIVIGAASLIFIVLFAAVTMYGRHHMRRRYSSKLNDEDMERSSGEWESKMAAAYENMAADTIYDAEDLHSDTYKKSYILD